MTTELMPSPVRSETKFLQLLFNEWARRSCHSQFGEVAIAGAPRWLKEAQDPDGTLQPFRGYGYSFEVDVLWRLPSERRVVELKHAWKYEPLALAEVLHHAYLLERCDSEGIGPVKPTVIGNVNVATRAAMGYLLEHGFQAESLEYLEFEHLMEGEERHYLWFDDPLAPWRHVDETLADLPREITESWDYWYRIDRTDSWIGTRQRVDGGRPLFMVVPFKMVSSIERHPGEFLVWEGTPPSLGIGAGHEWGGRFYRFTPTK